MDTLDRETLEELQRLCEWLNSIPYKSTYSGDIAQAHPDLSYWITSTWLPERKYVSVLFYQSGWGWRLRKNWRQRIDQLLAEFPRHDDAVLGGTARPRPGDVVLGGQ